MEVSSWFLRTEALKVYRDFEVFPIRWSHLPAEMTTRRTLPRRKPTKSEHQTSNLYSTDINISLLFFAIKNIKLKKLLSSILTNY